MRLERLSLPTRHGPLACALAQPETGSRAEGTAAGVLLLHFVSTGEVGFQKEPYVRTARVFLDAGCPVLSFGLPHHGERVDAHGEGIRGMCAAFGAGADPFQRFVDDGVDVVDHCLAAGLAAPGRIAVSGVSRSGYCALRLAAAEARVAAVAGLAPVTDWRVLKEFAEVRQRPEVAGLALDRWAAALAGRPVYLIIGNADDRVGTEQCLRFAQAIAAAEAGAGAIDSGLEVHVIPAAGHFLPEEEYANGARALLARVRGAAQGAGG